MTAQEVFEKLLSLSYKKREETCDGLIAGTPNKEVHKAATCFQLTAEMIEKASNIGIDMIVTHEPTFSHGDDRNTAWGIDKKKWQMLDESGIALYRFHDTPHDMELDLIHKGFLWAMGLEAELVAGKDVFGATCWELKNPISVKDLAEKLKKQAGNDFVRVVGDDSVTIKRVGLGLGNVGFNQLSTMYDAPCDAFITGEISEIFPCSYVRDACYFGEKKAMLVLGHYSSERDGMHLLAEMMNERMVPTEYLDAGEVYHSV